MKIKKFNNIWTMGLILFGAILVTFYIAKLFFPEWIVGVAEIPRIVEIGEYIDSHLWAYHLFDISFGFLAGYIYCASCCRVYKLNWKCCFIWFANLLLLSVIKQFIPEHYNMINLVGLIMCPFLMCYFDKNLTKTTFISTSVCFAVDILSQILSVEIRNLLAYTDKINHATMFILLIDAFIWRILLYLYFNNKQKTEKEI